jgi:adenosylcobinamide-GDP ribazoletransferase
MKKLWAAIGFLTVMPLPSVCRHTEEDLVRSVPFFPVVGLLIGLSAAGICMVLDGVFPRAVLSVILVGWLAVTHGGIHLDGLGDTADGFLSPNKKERVLEIMRDSSLGVFGCLAIWGGLALKSAAVFAMAQDVCVKALILAPLAARSIMVMMLAVLPPVHPNGLGRLFCPHRKAWESLWALAAMMGAGWLIAGAAGFMAGLTVLAITTTFVVICKRRIGGFTGDTIGAAGEIAETAVLLAFSSPLVHIFL